MTLLESMKLAPKGKALKLCTWNAQGLFLHAFSAGARAGQKFRELQRLCEGHSVVCVQEAHGSVLTWNHCAPPSPPTRLLDPSVPTVGLVEW